MSIPFSSYAFFTRIHSLHSRDNAADSLSLTSVPLLSNLSSCVVGMVNTIVLSPSIRHACDGYDVDVVVDPALMSSCACNSAKGCSIMYTRDANGLITSRYCYNNNKNHVCTAA